MYHTDHEWERDDQNSNRKHIAQLQQSFSRVVPNTTSIQAQTMRRFRTWLANLSSCPWRTAWTCAGTWEALALKWREWLKPGPILRGLLQRDTSLKRVTTTSQVRNIPLAEYWILQVRFSRVIGWEFSGGLTIVWHIIATLSLNRTIFGPIWNQRRSLAWGK